MIDCLNTYVLAVDFQEPVWWDAAMYTEQFVIDNRCYGHGVETVIDALPNLDSQ